MLVRILAMGLSHPLWKNVFHHLRATLPKENFAAGFFSSPDELAYLEQDYFPHAWRREPPDLLLSDAGAPADWERRLAFLARIRAMQDLPSPEFALTVQSLRPGLRQLVQGRQPVTLLLDNDTRITLSDPALLIEAFPEDYPRLRVNSHVEALRFPGGKRAGREVRPSAIPVGTLLSLGQIDAIVSGQESLAPQEWIKRVLKAERARVPRGAAPALYREQGGLFLFPGVPFGRVRGIATGGVEFSHLIDLGVLGETSSGFLSFVRAVERAGRHHAQALEALNARLRNAENRTDLPICCVGGVPALNAILAERLRARGYRRASSWGQGPLPEFDEPTLLIEPAPGRPDLPPQREDPLFMECGDELAPELALIESVQDWREVEGSYTRRPLERAAFLDESGKLGARAAKARAGLEFTERRILLLEQEVTVIEGGCGVLARLIVPGVKAWEGISPAKARQALVLSFDGEEAQVVFQSMPAVPKRRWLDLSPCLDPDSCHAMDLKPLGQYARGGAVFITPQARERVTHLQEQWSRRLAEQRQALDDALAARKEYEAELARIGNMQRELALCWMDATIERWLEAQEPRLLAALAMLRPRHEQSWFHRGQVNRVVLIASNGENRKALNEACTEVFPHYNSDHSTVIPYDYEPLDVLGAAERNAVIAQADKEELSAAETESRLVAALQEENDRLFSAYLDVLDSAVADLPRVDLLVLEHRPAVTARLIEHLRGLSGALKESPTLLVVPDTWAPPEEGHLPWPHTRVVPIRRMGALPGRECAKLIRALYSL